MTQHRRFKLALFTTMLLSVLALPVIGQAQTKEKFVVDTGIVALPATHQLRITAATPAVNDAATVAFRRLRYDEGTCSGDVCINEVVADDSTGPITIGPGEGASYRVSTIPGAPSIRVIVLCNSRDLRVTAELINQTTGEIVAIWVPQGSPVIAKP